LTARCIMSVIDWRVAGSHAGRTIICNRPLSTAALRMPGGSFVVSTAILSAASVSLCSHVLQGREQHLGSFGKPGDRLCAQRGHDFPALLTGDFFPPLRAVENDPPARILSQRDAGERLDHQRRLDAVGLKLGARDGEVGVDHGDVLAEIDAFGVGVNLDHLELRSPHVGGKLFTLEIGERFDVRVFGEDDEIGERKTGAEDA